MQLSNYNPCSTKHFDSTANDEWPEIMATPTTHCNPITKMIPTNMYGKSSSTITSQTKTEQVSLRNLSENDLTSLKQRDPFMYYSIPSVRHATMLENDVDLNTISNDQSANPIRRNCISCPGHIQTNAESSPSGTIKRQTRISFECHSDMILADLMEESDGGNDSDDDLDDPEQFLAMISARVSKNNAKSGQ